MGLVKNIKKRMEIYKWMSEKGEFYLTELIAKINGWSCECCGSDKNLDAYHLSKPEKDRDGRTIVYSTNENLVCLCPACYKKYHGNAVEALRHMTNPQVFKSTENDPRIRRYCRA